MNIYVKKHYSFGKGYFREKSNELLEIEEEIINQMDGILKMLVAQENEKAKFSTPEKEGKHSVNSRGEVEKKKKESEDAPRHTSPDTRCYEFSSPNLRNIKSEGQKKKDIDSPNLHTLKKIQGSEKDKDTKASNEEPEPDPNKLNKINDEIDLQRGDAHKDSENSKGEEHKTPKKATPSKASLIIHLDTEAKQHLKKHKISHKEKFKQIFIPYDIVLEFVHISNPNTLSDIETCAILAGKELEKFGGFVVTDLIVPKQSATHDTCSMHESAVETLYESQTNRDVLTLGWIHTHPAYVEMCSF